MSRAGVILAHITEHICLELQGMLGFDVSFGRARGTGEPGVYRVLVAYKEEEPARAAFATALRLTLAAMHDEPFDLPSELEHLSELADEYRLGPSTAAIVAAARKRRIPVLRLTPTRGLIQLGYGIYQQRIQASETSTTSAIAVDTCQDKALTNQLLRVVGVPMPEGRPASSADEAWKVAQDVGLPVVLKPVDGHQGKGVSVNLSSKEEIRAAYAIAEEHGAVLVERYITGNDYRLLVVGGKAVIDTDFAERGRMSRILGAVAQNPRNLGLGIDEDTAVVVEGGRSSGCWARVPSTSWTGRAWPTRRSPRSGRRAW